MALLTPEYLQTKTYSALRDRIALAHAGPLQQGVWGSTDFAVVQRGLGANMSVDVGAGYAWVPANDPGNLGLYHTQNDATVNVAVTAAHATLPRIDQVVLTVNDTTHGGDASDSATLTVLAGTPTSGATLTNRTGAAALGTGQLRLADVLVPAASSSVVTANLLDRRSWARGVFYTAQRTAGDVTAPGSFTDIDASLFTRRFEFTGSPVAVTIRGEFNHASTANSEWVFRLMDNGSYAVGTNNNPRHTAPVAGRGQSFTVVHTYTPAAGSHQLAPQHLGGVGPPTLNASASAPLEFTVEEILRQSSTNG